MVNKRGWLRVVEATTAVLLIIGATLLLSRANIVESQPKDYDQIGRTILEDIAINTTLRSKVIQYDISQLNIDSNKEIIDELNSFIKNRVRYTNLNYTLVICEVKGLCFTKSYPEGINEIYTAERIISTDVNQPIAQDPRRVKLFIWSNK
jgi:hypothetical protein